MNKIKIIYGIESTSGGSLKHVLYLSEKLDKRYFDITILFSDKRCSEIITLIDKLNHYGVKYKLIPMSRNINLIYDYCQPTKV